MTDAPTRLSAVRVAIVDDHPVVADGTAALLRAVPGIEIVAVVGSLAEAASAGLADGAHVDVVLLDIRLGEDSGLRFLSEGPADSPRDGAPRPAVIVLTAYDYPQYAEAALRLGAAGLVLKTAPLSELTDAIQRVAAGGLAFARRPVERTAIHLTPRERDVLALVVDGRTNDEIGVALGIGSKTVETYLARMFERFELVSRTELTARCLREGWLDLPPT